MSTTLSTLTLTPAQIVRIYKAGIKRGAEEATAYDWGSKPNNPELEQLECLLVWDSPEFIGGTLSYDEKLAWWDTFVKAATTS